MYALILAGGSGTRFWPLSRPERPKQLVKLFGNGPMVLETVRRLRDVVEPEHVKVVCGTQLAAQTLEAAELPLSQGVIEPMARNTCAAIALGVVNILAEAGDQVVAVMPSDHYVRDTKAFTQLLQQAETLAKEGHIVTLGIEPTRPETGFGYIRCGASHGNSFDVEAFVEKPNLETALNYLEAGNYVWNAGIFVFQASVFLRELERQKPAIYEAFLRIQKGIGNEDPEILVNEFQKMESVSVDYAIMEGAENMRVIPANVGWSDVGHWAAIPEVLDADSEGNVTNGRTVLVDARDNIVFSENDSRPIALLGVCDLIVVDTPEAILVLPRDRAQDVRLVAEKFEPK